MTDYQKTKIYKIESNQGDKIYVGSTAKEYLSQRFQQHKHAYKRWREGKCGKVMSYELFEEYGPENCQIVLIESYPCNSKDEKNSREGHYIKELNCVNKHIAGRSPKESLKAYLETDKGKQALIKVKETHKAYWKSDRGKEKSKAAQKSYRESDKGKEAIKRAQKKHYEKVKEQSKDKENNQTNEEEEVIEVPKSKNGVNKEKISQRKKKYYIENKEKLLDQGRKRYHEKKAMKTENDL